MLLLTIKFQSLLALHAGFGEHEKGEIEQV